MSELSQLNRAHQHCEKLPFLPRVILHAMDYLVMGYAISAGVYIISGTLIQLGVREHLPKRKWLERRPALESIRLHRKLYPDSYLVPALWISVIAALAFWSTGAYLQYEEKHELRNSNAPQVQND